MSREATLSTLGLYQWDNTLFDLMQIPLELDKEVLIQNLLAETAELEILYSNPTVLKNLIGVWSHKQLPIWKHLYDTTTYEYNPIENYDRQESGSGATTHSGADTRTVNSAEGGTETTTDTNSGTDRTTGERDTLNKIAGFNNGGTLVDQSKQEEDTSGSLTHGKKTVSETEFGKTDTTTDRTAYGQVIENENTLRAHGNIGVTTTQEMIKQEREIALFNIYDAIIEDYKHRFCVLVY